MKKAQEDALIQAAIDGHKNAFCPLTGYAVGAALLTASGRIYQGCNVESPTSIFTCCAERVALFAALAQGERRVVAVSTASPGSLPCGVCRQALLEFGSLDMPVYSVMLGRGSKPRKVVKTRLGKILPGAHTGETVAHYTK